MHDAGPCMLSEKTPGLDGIPIEVYKLFMDKLLHPLWEMLEESGILPPSLQSALITLVPKPGKPPTEDGPYRPISLNVLWHDNPL